MALKSYLIDKELLRTFLSPKHEVTKNGVTTMYRLIEGDSELDMKKQRLGGSPKVIFLGQRVFSTDDETIQRFIESKPYFGTKITIYDPVSENKKNHEEKVRSIELLKKVASFTKEKILEIGYALFGRMSLDYIKNGDMNGLHNEIIDEAGNNPERVNELLEDKSNKHRLYAGYLIATGVFDVSIDDRYINWGHNGSQVYVVPNGISPVDGLAEFFQTSEGSEVKKEASMILEKKVTNVDAPDTGSPNIANDDTTDDAEKKKATDGRGRGNKTSTKNQ